MSLKNLNLQNKTKLFHNPHETDFSSPSFFLQFIFSAFANSVTMFITVGSFAVTL